VTASRDRSFKKISESIEGKTREREGRVLRNTDDRMYQVGEKKDGGKEKRKAE